MHPYKDECCHKRKADGCSIRHSAPFPRYQLKCKTGAEQEDPGDKEIDFVPDHFIGKLHRHQGHHRYEGYNGGPHTESLGNVLPNGKCHVLADYTHTIRLKPSYLSAYWNRGRVYFENGELDQGTADLEKAIELAENALLRRQLLQEMESLKRR